MFAPSPITNPPLIGSAPARWDFTSPEVAHVYSRLDSLGNDVSIDANAAGKHSQSSGNVPLGSIAGAGASLQLSTAAIVFSWAPLQSNDFKNPTHHAWPSFSAAHSNSSSASSGGAGQRTAGGVVDHVSFGTGMDSTNE
nr:hypothetical protein Iba_chr04fCG5270 [Ipomoea batatas]